MRHWSTNQRRNLEFSVTINKSMADAQICKEGTTLLTFILAIYRNSGYNYYTYIANKFFETMEKFKYFVYE
jgi:hypothetical protein